MKIPEMHVWFRQYAQQMGMQNVRAIYPEQIDILINTSISDIVNQLVRENVGIRNDRVITDNSKIGQINALRSLYKVKKILTGNTPKNLQPNSDYASVGLFSITDFITDAEEDARFAIDNLLYIVDLSIDYTRGEKNYTRLFPIRIIEDAYLADTLNDFVLKPRLRTPVGVIYENKLDLYLGEDYAKANGQIESKSSINIAPHELRVSYIAAPKKVKYISDVTGSTSNNVDCDLPESMHVDILKHAVDLYNTSVNGGLYNAQRNDQNQQREAARNEARPTNEGYQN